MLISRIGQMHSQNLACKDEVCLDVGCSPQTAAALMSKMSSSNALGMSPAEIPCPQSGGGGDGEAPADGKPAKDAPRDASPKKPAKPKKEKPAATQLQHMSSCVLS